MKKETFVKLISAVLDAQKRRIDLDVALCNALKIRTDKTGETPNFLDLTYDSVFEDDVMNAFIEEFGEEKADKIYQYVYDSKLFDIELEYGVEEIEELYDNITKN